MATSDTTTASGARGTDIANAVEFDGKLSELFALVAVNWGLTILTLGVYRFWAKTRVRRYLWNHMIVFGQRLEYTGRGIHLFLGFLIVLVFFILPLVAVNYFWIPTIADPELIATINTIQFAIIVYIIPVALFRARRYRLNHTRWRGIRFGQTGNSWFYGLFAVWTYFIAYVSLGFALPVADMMRMRFQMRRTWVGNQQVTFTGDSGPTYGPFLLSYFSSIIGYIILFMIAFTLFFGALYMQRNGIGDGTTDPDKMAEVIMSAIVRALPFLVLFGVGAAFIYSLWGFYTGAFYREVVRKTEVMGLTFRVDYTLGQFFRFYFVNLAILMFTLTLGMFWVYVRTGRFIAKHGVVEGKLDEKALRQSEQEAPGAAEGFLDAFDFGGI